MAKGSFPVPAREPGERPIDEDPYDRRGGTITRPFLEPCLVEAAKLELELHSVRAPFAGVVSLVRGRPGEWVEPGSPVLRLVAIDKV